MIQTPQPRWHRDERGQVSAEYAVGTLVVVALGGFLFDTARDQWAIRLALRVLDALSAWFLSFLLALPLPR